jgi:hypothetical protein
LTITCHVGSNIVNWLINTYINIYKQALSPLVDHLIIYPFTQENTNVQKNKTKRYFYFVNLLVNLEIKYWASNWFQGWLFKLLSKFMKIYKTNKTLLSLSLIGTVTNKNSATVSLPQFCAWCYFKTVRYYFRGIFFTFVLL